MWGYFHKKYSYHFHLHQAIKYETFKDTIKAFDNFKNKQKAFEVNVF